MVLWGGEDQGGGQRKRSIDVNTPAMTNVYCQTEEECVLANDTKNVQTF